jgi:hypothetical protein
VSAVDRTPRYSPLFLGPRKATEAGYDVFCECVELRLERSYPSEFDILLVSHLNQQGFYP